MKVIALTILLLTLALIGFATSRSRKQTSATPDVRDYLYAEPFRGSVVGKRWHGLAGTATRMQRISHGTATYCRSRGGSKAMSEKAAKN